MPTNNLIDAATIGERADRERASSEFSLRHTSARAWVRAFQTNDIENTKETSMQGIFLRKVFCDILGYTDQGTGEGHWTLVAEPSADVNSRAPDGGLGFFSSSAKTYRAVIELKDALTDLDAKQLNRRDRLSPVEQAFLYVASFENAEFALVSNFRELRLYSKKFGMARYEVFDLLRIGEVDELAKLLALCQPRMLIGDGTNRLSRLRQLLRKHPLRDEQDITDRFYEVYSHLRDRFVAFLSENHPSLADGSVGVIQKLMDRILFVAYAEDVGLLPPNLISNTVKQGLQSRERSNTRVWREIKFLFEDVDQGRPDHAPAINHYNGGLFRHDEVLDEEIELPDELVSDIVHLADFDFTTEIDVNILGNVFEYSIADLEALKRNLSLDPHEVTRDSGAVDQQRRDLGVYYTPSWVTGYIADQTIGGILQERGIEARQTIRILDPACGSGAFLSAALSYLDDQRRSLRTAAEAVGDVDLFHSTAVERTSDYLEQLFGVDLLPESVEITKLALWLKSADRSERLGRLPSVISANTLAPESDAAGLAGTLVGEIGFADGFEVVIGNPPWGATLNYELASDLSLAEGQFDSYELFVERSLSLLAQGGLFGFIVPDSILRPEGERIRRFLFSKHKIKAVLKVGEGVFPGVFRAGVVIIGQKEPPAADDTYQGLIVRKQDRLDLEKLGALQLTTIASQHGGEISRSRVVDDEHFDIALAPDFDLDLADTIRSGRNSWIGTDGIFEIHGRGVELGPDSFVVQCPACFEWAIGPRKRSEARGGGFEAKTCPGCGHEYSVDEAADRQDGIVSDAFDPDDTQQVPLLSGAQVNRYWYDPPLGLRVGVPGIDYKAPELYQSPKILIRQTGLGIYASLDDSETRCTQSVFVYREPRAPDVQLEFYLAQLNSRAMLFFYFTLTNQVEWQSYPRLVHRTIQRLPLWIPDLDDHGQRRAHDEMVELVRTRMELAVAQAHSGVSADALRVDQEIEGLVAGFYGLTPEQRARITNRLRPEQQIRIIRELYPPAESLLET